MCIYVSGSQCFGIFRSSTAKYLDPTIGLTEGPGQSLLPLHQQAKIIWVFLFPLFFWRCLLIFFWKNVNANKFNYIEKPSSEYPDTRNYGIIPTQTRIIDTQYTHTYTYTYIPHLVNYCVSQQQFLS